MTYKNRTKGKVGWDEALVRGAGKEGEQGAGGKPSQGGTEKD